MLINDDLKLKVQFPQWHPIQLRHLNSRPSFCQNDLFGLGRNFGQGKGALICAMF